MGKKNKYKKDEGSSDNKKESQEQPQSSQAGPKKPQGQQQQNTQQGAWGGGQSHQQQKPPQGPQTTQGQQQQKPQQGAWGGGQHHQQQKPPQGPQTTKGQQQQKPQQGAWGGGQHHQQQKPPQGPQTTQGQQQQKPQQGAWGGGQHHQQQKPPQGPQTTQGQQQQKPQQGAYGGGQHQQQHKPQQGSSRQQDGGGQHQQQWASGKQQRSGQQPGDRSQHRDPGRQQGGVGQQQRPQQHDQARQHGDAGPQRGGWSQQRDPGRQQGGEGRQQRPQQGRLSQDQNRPGQQQQYSGSLSKMEELTISEEIPLPVMEKSSNGIVRGTLGKPGVVEVNYLKLDLKNMPKEAYHYDVTITPDRPKKFLRPAFEQCRLQMFPDVFSAFDGMKSCYTLQRLQVPIDLKIEVPDSGNRMKEFQVQIQETDSLVVDLESLRTYQNERVSDKPMRALQVLEVVLASNNHKLGVRVGRSFFRRPDDAYNLQDGYEAWTGLYQAAILGEQPLLNVDIAHKSFPCESTVIDYLRNQRIDINQDIRSDRNFRDVATYFKGINIVYTPPESFGAPAKQYKVLEVGDPASQKKFKNDEGIELTVANYFKSRGCTLRYPNLNCLSVGSTVRQISLPIEFCSIPSGQALNRKDKDRQVQNMIRYAATSTNRRKQKIMELLRYFDHNDNPIIREFGLRIGSNFIKVPMRLLPAPYMEYLQGQTVTTFKGAWRMDNLKFLLTSKPPSGHKWAIIYEENQNRGISYHDLETFKTNVIRTSQNLSMNLQNSADIKSFNFRNLQSMLKQLASDKYDLVFVVLSERGTPYAKIKQTAELEVGILTQCIKVNTIYRTVKDITVFSNILLKVNGKLNGTNHKIAQERDPNLLSPIKNVMYLGADVTHPSPDQRHIPSVVGVAASHDAHGACYNCQYRLQRSTVENIEDMESIARWHLEVYRKYQKSYPSLIIYYRDGVSDGQFPIVEREEIRAIRSACKKLGCSPKLTCVIVVKRHHTRFFPLTKPQHERDFNNVQAGTVVDQHITHPNEVQFFMVSHQSIQGTARPTRYNVILDESKFNINLLQKLTYNLCHLFPRCNRAVSYPAPAYLAHLVAFRGRVYLEGTFKFDKNLNKEYEKRLIRPEFLTRNPMYFI